jgi:F0F1-type ATP synthase beta subunit
MVVSTEVKGKIVQVQGAVVDIEFPTGQLPEIYGELLLRAPDGKIASLRVSASAPARATICTTK